MDKFEDVLLSKQKSNMIPDEYNFFGRLVGGWDFDWIWNKDKGRKNLKGEWVFSWVIEGTAIQDVFICPSRSTRADEPQADAEYGTTTRVYVPDKKAWDIAYACEGELTILEAKKEGEKIVLTNTKNKNSKWVFSEIEDDSFHWQNITVCNDGTWYVNADLYATRKK